jgi:hypothetical protein
MNRLVIIGNGFDLAHGLPTSYKDFIDDYWKSIKSTSHNDNFVSFENIGSSIQVREICNLEDLANFIKQYDDKIKFSDAEIYREYGNNISGKYPRAHILNYKNVFFRLINQKSIQNWVDIENEYYRELKKIMKSKCMDVSKTDDYWLKVQKVQVEKLNFDFEEVKNLLDKYLNKIDKIQNSNISILKYFKLIKENVEDYFLEFPRQDRAELEKFQKEYDANREIGINKSTYCLNFNYTQSIDSYVSITKQHGEDRNFGQFDNLQIHGRLNDINNKINFGFGDEMDEDYKTIENLDDNEFLKNFKSFQYLQNSNYKTLLDFVESNKFQVFIMGHSCGLSDRTLLNTIFEHTNCRSIKVFYYEEKDGHGKVIKDNYTEIIQNISRHFNKKKLMREKIVNKTLCQPLPQIQLPLK